MKIWSKTPSYVYETCKGHVSALVWNGLKLGTSNTQKKIYFKKIIFLTQEVLRCSFLYVVLADLWGHEGRYGLRPQAMCMRPARAMWVLWFEMVWSWELPTLKKLYVTKNNNLLDPRGSEMFFLYVVLADLWAHVGRYDLRPQAMCTRPARAMWVLWFERVWSWEFPTLKKHIFLKNILDPRGSEMFFLYVVLADLWGHEGRYDLRPQAMCMRLARAMWVLWFERVWSWELPTLKKNIFKNKK